MGSVLAECGQTQRNGINTGDTVLEKT